MVKVKSESEEKICGACSNYRRHRALAGSFVNAKH
jgi:hypothetical protein